MRELALYETGFLAVGLILSLALPLTMSAQRCLDEGTTRFCTKVIWMAHLILALAGLTILASHPWAAYAAGVGLMGFVGCATALFRRLRVARLSRSC